MGDSTGGECRSDGVTVWGAGYPGGRSWATLVRAGKEIGTWGVGVARQQ